MLYPYVEDIKSETACISAVVTGQVFAAPESDVPHRLDEVNSLDSNPIKKCNLSFMMGPEKVKEYSSSSNAVGAEPFGKSPTLLSSLDEK